MERLPKKYDRAYIVDERSAFPQEGNVFYVGSQLTIHEAKAITAFSKLLKLRRDWIGEWEPQCNTKNYYIFYNQLNGSFLINWFIENNRSLSFPTNKMAEEFLKTFFNLIEEVKILI